MDSRLMVNGHARPREIPGAWTEPAEKGGRTFPLKSDANCQMRIPSAKTGCEPPNPGSFCKIRKQDAQSGFFLRKSNANCEIRLPVRKEGVWSKLSIPKG